MWRGHRAVVGNLVALIVPAYPDLDAPTRITVARDVTRYVCAQIELMSGFLRIPYKLAVTAFNWLALLRYGRTFRHLTTDRQEAYLALWSEGPVGLTRDFVKLIRSTALLVYFDHPLVLERLEVERLRRPSGGLPQTAAAS